MVLLFFSFLFVRAYFGSCSLFASNNDRHYSHATMSALSRRPTSTMTWGHVIPNMLYLENFYKSSEWNVMIIEGQFWFSSELLFFSSVTHSSSSSNNNDETRHQFQVVCFNSIPLWWVSKLKTFITNHFCWKVKQNMASVAKLVEKEGKKKFFTCENWTEKVYQKTRNIRWWFGPMADEKKSIVSKREVFSQFSWNFFLFLLLKCSWKLFCCVADVLSLVSSLKTRNHWLPPVTRQQQYYKFHL